MASISNVEILISNYNWSQITVPNDGGGSLNMDKVLCLIEYITFNKVFFSAC